MRQARIIRHLLEPSLGSGDPRAWAIAALVATCLGCAPGDPSAIALSLEFDDSVSDEALAAIARLGFSSSGDELHAQELTLDRAVTRSEGLLYRPRSTSRRLMLTVRAVAADGALLATGRSGELTPLASGRVSAAIRLGGHGSSTGFQCLSSAECLSLPDGRCEADGQCSYGLTSDGGPPDAGLLDGGLFDGGQPDSGGVDAALPAKIPSYRSHATANDGGSNASASVVNSKPAGVVAGDLLLWAVAYDATNGTITWPTGWTQLQQATSNADQATLFVAYKIAAAEAVSYSATLGSADWWSSVIVAYRDGASATPTSSAGASSTATSSPWSIPAPSVTTTTNNARLVWFGAIDNVVDQSGMGIAFTAPSGYTNRVTSVDNNWCSVNVSDALQATLGASGVVSGSATGAGTAGKLAVLVAIAPAP